MHIKPSGRAAFPTWRKLRLGFCTSSEAYRRAILAAGVTIEPDANDILEKIHMGDEAEVDLVLAQVKDLNGDFWDGAEYERLCHGAAEHGLELCAAEVGPALRLQYPDQPSTEHLRIAMEPIACERGTRALFDVNHWRNTGLRLGASLVLGGSENPDRRFVFMRR